MSARETDARMRRDRELADVEHRIVLAERLIENSCWTDNGCPTLVELVSGELETLQTRRTFLLEQGARRPY